jgi:hypothetical protein
LRGGKYESTGKETRHARGSVVDIGRNSGRVECPRRIRVIENGRGRGYCSGLEKGLGHGSRQTMSQIYSLKNHRGLS